ncbi:unnamed protein product, partial [Pylaiella littoralis]
LFVCHLCPPPSALPTTCNERTVHDETGKSATTDDVTRPHRYRSISNKRHQQRNTLTVTLAINAANDTTTTTTTTTNNNNNNDNDDDDGSFCTWKPWRGPGSSLHRSSRAWRGRWRSDRGG